MKKEIISADYVIIGAGIIGLALAKGLKEKFPNKKIIVLEKEKDVACHTSGRNSGVLHAGFYYTSNSLKAKFCKNGNEELKEYCRKHNLKINEVGKVVVTTNEKELEVLHELFRRGQKNGVEVYLIDEKELKEIDPNAKTYKQALWSPTTATVDPVEVCQSLKQKLVEEGVFFYFQTPYKKRLTDNTIKAGKYIFEAEKFINVAGLYADKIAKDFGFGEDYTIIPFKGVYLEYTKNDKPVRTNIYPVPNLKNPFLGVHFTIKVDGTIKIGPTAMPAFWRENYRGFSKIKLNELIKILYWEGVLFFTNAFGFRSLAIDEIKKYRKNYLISLAKKLVHRIDENGFTKWGKPGIRAQLLNTKTKKLVYDFVVEGDKNSLHILNAVSPAFTCAFPFTRWVIENYISGRF
jgi:L-2-hydroxyglutarate oxidase LhgO